MGKPNIMAMQTSDAIEQTLAQAIDTLKTQGVLPQDWQATIQLTRTKDRVHGDFASNLAMMAAKMAGKKPRDLAQLIVDALPQHNEISRVEIAGPGFINFFLNANARFAVLDVVLKQKEHFGCSQVFAGQHVQVEFVSANPTSSLHVGHGRGAAFGMSVANLLEAIGWQVTREYYVNDAGRQMDILATSTYLRYLELCGESVVFPSNGYQGDYVTHIAQSIFAEVGKQYCHASLVVFTDVPADAVYSRNTDGEKVLVSGDKEAHIDGLIANSQTLLAEDYEVFHDAALNSILTDIKDDLAEFGVEYAVWYSEKTLSDKIEVALAKLQEQGHLYEQDGNLWFKSSEFGDEKDRVVKRANGQTTYFAADIAYHYDKFLRGFDKVINVWGADHHGYIPRVRAALTALGIDEKRLDVILVQFVTLWRGAEQVQMSSRSGQFVTLRALREEVGSDAARFYYVARKPEQHIDFDLELAKSQSKDNAVYYIQYAHARVCRVLEKLAEQGLIINEAEAIANQDKLTADIETELMAKLAAYPDTLMRAATGYEPHILTHYLKDLAALFHAWYNEYRILSEDKGLMQARLRLSLAVKQVVSNGLNLLGLTAPTSM